MEKTFQELPNWTFWIDEVSLGRYRVNGKNALFDSNLELTGEFPDEMLNEAKAHCCRHGPTSARESS
jgi:hypothetical protein